MRSIQEIMEARSVAVIGASRDEGKPGAQLLRILKDVGYQGRVAGINQQGGEVFNTTLYRNMQAVPFDVDLAVLLIPPRFIPDALRECARKGVKGAVISAEGFAETGEQGAKIQDDVREILKSTGMRGFGPNTLGLVNTETKLTTSYFANGRMMREGRIGFAAQSGIFVGALLRYLSSLDGFQLSKGIGLGNKVDVNETDALSYLMDDPKTEIIGLYLEDVKDGRAFADKVKEASAKKPVLVIKSGRTQAGAKATASHTASIAVEDAVFDGVMRQAGAIRLFDIVDFLNTLKGFLNMPLPKGNRLALVTFSGAQGIMSIDAAVEQGLEIGKFGEATKTRIAQVISTPSKIKNPIDIYPDALTHGYEKTLSELLKALLDDDAVDGMIFISFADADPEIYRPMVDILKNDRRKPAFVSLLGDAMDKETSKNFLDKNGIPCFDFPEQAVRVFAHMRQYAGIKQLSTDEGP